MSIEGHNAMVSRGWARVLWPSVAVASGLWGAAMAGDLPPPPGSMEAVADAQLFLELVVNQMDTGRVIAVEQRAGLADDAHLRVVGRVVACMDAVGRLCQHLAILDHHRPHQRPHQ